MILLVSRQPCLSCNWLTRSRTSPPSSTCRRPPSGLRFGEANSAPSTLLGASPLSLASRRNGGSRLYLTKHPVELTANRAALSQDYSASVYPVSNAKKETLASFS